jgi:hypothetical protein
MPAVEEFGVEPIPAELRTVGWRDLFAINAGQKDRGRRAASYPWRASLWGA